MEDAGEVQVGEVTEPGDVIQIGLQPAFQRRQQGRITDVRPLTGSCNGQLQPPQQADPRLPLTQLRGPGQQCQAFALHQAEHGPAALLSVQPGQGFTRQHQLTDLALTLGTQGALTLIPVQHLQRADLLSQHRVEQLRLQLGRQVDAFLALPLTATQVRHHQPGVFHQTIGFGKQRGTAIGQAVFRAAFAALLGNPIRIGKRQQGAQPARMLRITDCLRAGLAFEVTLKLPGQLPGTLYAALGTTGGPRLTRKQSQAAVQISPCPPQNVTFTEQGGQIASECTQAQFLAAQQQMSNTRMSGQFGHGLAMSGQFALSIHRAQPRQQLQRLGISGCRWRIQPNQLGRLYPPTHQLQRQPGKVGLKYFRRTVSSQLLMLRL